MANRLQWPLLWYYQMHYYEEQYSDHINNRMQLWPCVTYLDQFEVSLRYNKMSVLLLCTHTAATQEKYNHHGIKITDFSCFGIKLNVWLLTSSELSFYLLAIINIQLPWGQDFKPHCSTVTSSTVLYLLHANSSSSSLRRRPRPYTVGWAGQGRGHTHCRNR